MCFWRKYKQKQPAFVSDGTGWKSRSKKYFKFRDCVVSLASNFKGLYVILSYHKVHVFRVLHQGFFLNPVCRQPLPPINTFTIELITNERQS